MTAIVSSADVDSPATLDTELTVPATGALTDEPTDSDSSLKNCVSFFH